MAKPKSMKEMKILLAEDEADLSAVYAKKLVRSGFSEQNIIRADDGQKAIEYLNFMKFDLVITGIDMPGSNGFSLLEHIKVLKDQPLVIVITRENAQNVLVALEGIKKCSYVDRKMSIGEVLKKMFDNIIGFFRCE